MILGVKIEKFKDSMIEKFKCSRFFFGFAGLKDLDFI